MRTFALQPLWCTYHAPPCVVSSAGPSVLSPVSAALPFRVVLVLSCVYSSKSFLLSCSVLLLLSVFLFHLVCIFDPPRLCYCRRVSRGFLLLVSLCYCRGIPCTRRYCLGVADLLPFAFSFLCLFRPLDPHFSIRESKSGVLCIRLSPIS